jgi:hypothetical protein
MVEFLDDAARAPSVLVDKYKTKEELLSILEDRKLS